MPDELEGQFSFDECYDDDPTIEEELYALGPSPKATSPLSAAVDPAPHRAGVYFFLDAAHELLYVGKASDLKARLRQHARSTPRRGELRMELLYQRVTEVRWEELRDEGSAAAREADLIVALRPVFNASHTDLAESDSPREPYLEPGLARDRRLAESFFAYGPQALRRLRLRHRLHSGPMSKAVIEQPMAADFCSTIGEFRVPLPRIHTTTRSEGTHTDG